MLRILKQFILTTLFVVFASQASAMFIQADTLDPTGPGVGTNRYAYSNNDPINRLDPNGYFSYNVDDKEYTIDDGDTWESISDQTGVGVDELQKLNGTKFEVGEVFSLPRTKNIEAFEWAAGQIGAKSYSYQSSIGAFGPNTNKCNAFCGDAYTIGAGSAYPTRQRTGWRAFFAGRNAGTPATAGAMATNGQLPHSTRKLRASAVLGDVVAWPKEFEDATGHAGIYTGNLNITANQSFPNRPNGNPMIMSRQPGDFGFISAGGTYTNYATGNYMMNHPFEYGMPGFRRID